MTRYLTLAEVLNLYERVIAVGGGAFALRDLGALETALAQPRATYGGEDLYVSLAEKAGAFGFSLIMNHPFVDGNKRIGHASLEVFLVLNGFELSANVDDSERIVLGVAEGKVPRDEFVQFISVNMVALQSP